jgi:NADH:ubiquinone reductase (H+-translocating)
MPRDMPLAETATGQATRPTVVIVGAGFGGLQAAKDLARAPVDVVVVDRRNYHLFQPLLYQVATASLSPADIAQPIRGIVGKNRNTAVVMDRVTGVDTERREVLTASRRIPYDVLILATGARHAYFGHDDWEPVAPGLKKIDDATDIRRRILSAFEDAESTESEPERRQLLTFVVVGAGPTGVEMAGAIAELAKRALAKDFRRIDPRTARILLVEAGPRVLPAFPERLSAIAQRSLARLGVEVVVGKAVSHCDARSVRLGAETIPTRTIIWAAGVEASSAATWLGVEADHAGRIKVEPDLRVSGLPGVYAIGDTATIAGPDGKPLPGIAPVAKQQGRYAARAIRERLAGREPAPFHYRHFGSMATIGRKAAVAELGRMRLWGAPAWLLWGAAHIFFLIGFRNRISVMLSWLWAYATFQSGARLITGSQP